MTKGTSYQSKMPGPDGVIHYTVEENAIWQTLVERQLACIEGRACQEYLDGLALLNLPTQRVPQLSEINAVLADTTGWQVAQVPALIPFDEFFALLASKRFPVATFIRRREELDYLQEPDIFHEIFGHCPLLTNPDFAHFTHLYGQLGLNASKEARVYLARLYWFTVEFGLVNTNKGLRIYGGGILSSPGETHYALSSSKAERKPFAALDALRTPYRIDIMQPVYYVLDNVAQLFDVAQQDILALVDTAKALGLYEPKFQPKQKQAS
ncbi:phenylalanine 4-monooxygenase [Gallaecimonas mangrovi]|uniref:phenylalanine 4-monooxygenase n=1 Tax=Gallaecimonas mangrovi TaxID=2291597 RepID=UPI000E2010BC|nr:phenylalanine 4-monooxygenase [Gallaecimonas mangrovi]